MYYYYDYSWFILIPAMIFTFLCQARINNAYRQYSQAPDSDYPEIDYDPSILEAGPFDPGW